MNRGAQLLSGRIQRGDQRAMATRLDIDEGYLSRIVRGERLPGLSLRVRFEDEEGIPLRSWDEPPDPETVADPAKGAA